MSDIAASDDEDARDSALERSELGPSGEGVFRLPSLAALRRAGRPGPVVTMGEVGAERLMERGVEQGEGLGTFSRWAFGGGL
jgi:hypothetical protein